MLSAHKASAAVSISVSPTSTSMLANATTTFTATVLNASNTAVTWSAILGNISSSGVYTAPSVLGTSTLTDTITATSVQDNTKAATAMVTVSSGLVGWWPLTEGTGTTAYDQSGNGHNGNWAGSASSTNGHYSTNAKVGSYSGYFDGTTNQVNISSGFNIASSSAISEMAWVDLSSAQTNSAPTIMWLSGTGYQAQLGLTGSSTVWSLRPCVNGNCPTDGSGNHVNANQWALVAFTYTGGASGTMAIYLNGVLDATTTAISPNTGTPTSLIINWTAFSTSGFFNDARVYSRALSPAEVAAIYDSVPPSAVLSITTSTPPTFPLYPRAPRECERSSRGRSWVRCSRSKGRETPV